MLTKLFRNSAVLMMMLALALVFAPALAAQDVKPATQEEKPPEQQQGQKQGQKTDVAPEAQPQEQKAVEAPAEKKEESKGDKKEEKQEAKKEAMQQGTPVFWQEPADIASRNLLLGPGGDGMKPDFSRVTFVEAPAEGGYSVKWRVRDGAGKTWVAKLGNEAQPETAATRLVWAAGYPTEVTYLAPCVKIENAPTPPDNKSIKRCEGNGFANVRFEARPDDQKRLDNWSWDKNPFAGTKEFAGLVVMMALVNNWDLKDANNRIINAPGGELRYVVSDLGATFGKTGNFITHSRNEPEKYIKTKFVEKVEGGRVKFDYNGKKGSLFDNITVEQAKWIGDLLSQLSEEQVKDAFRAANYSPEDVEGLAQEVLARINSLHSLGVAPAAAGSTGQPQQ
ncbi:MAG TPA: hypothetical protein VNZ44_17225 [Pyrinomonadaceae bacterium]|nr:hypothetical protein [Pyrinomonadaceae bacterium]